MKPVPVVMTPKRTRASQSAQELYTEVRPEIKILGGGMTDSQPVVVDEEQRDQLFDRACKISDYWVLYPDQIVRVHVKRRKALFTSVGTNCPVDIRLLSTDRMTHYT